jgi:hypothetical protein
MASFSKAIDTADKGPSPWAIRSKYIAVYPPSHSADTGSFLDSKPLGDGIFVFT